MPGILPRLTAALADRYDIAREIGAGGMATVYLAQDIRHQRRVAVKVLHPELAAMLGAERFLAEIHTTAKLQHPHILPLHDSGEADGLLFYVMPYIPGETLRGRLQSERQLPVGDAVRIAAEVASALAYAHRQGVVHRDIKPENILLHEGSALVADFGIALAMSAAAADRLTHTGLSLGTPHYMSPEQATGDREIGPRSDVYALGVVLYEMLAGEPPFTGPTAQAVVARVLTEKPASLTARRERVPLHVAEAVAVALEKLPADRFGGAADFGAALANSAWRSGAPAAGTGGVDAAAPRDGSPRARRRLTAHLMTAGAGLTLGLAIGVGATLGAGVRAGGSRVAEPPAPMRFHFAPQTTTMRAVCCGQMFAISPDGQRVVFQGASDEVDGAVGHALFVRELNELTERRLPGTAGARSLFFSPDGEEIAFTANQTLYRLRIDAGAPRQVTRLPDGYEGGGTWLSDGTIVFAVQDRLYRISIATGEAVLLHQLETSDRQITWPNHVAEGNAIIYAVVGFDALPTLHWLPLATGAPRAIARGVAPVYVAQSRRLLAVRDDGTLVAWPFDPVRGDTAGPPVRIVEGVVLRSPVVAFAEYAASATGIVVRALRPQASGTGWQANLNVIDSRDSARAAIPLPPGGGFYEWPRFSPDGKRLAVAVRDGQTRIHSLFVYDLDRAAVLRLGTGTDPLYPVWLGTGDTVLYRIGRQEFRLMPADGSGAERSVLTLRDWAALASHSAHGPWIAFVGQRFNGTDTGIIIAHRDSGGVARPFAVSRGEVLSPAISPDGEWLAFSSAETGRRVVYVSSFPVQGGRYPVAQDARLPVWSSDGRVLYYQGGEDGMYAVDFTPGSPPSFGAPRLLRRRPGSPRHWSVDGTGTRHVISTTHQLSGHIDLEFILNGVPPADPRQQR